MNNEATQRSANQKATSTSGFGMSMGKPKAIRLELEQWWRLLLRAWAIKGKAVWVMEETRLLSEAHWEERRIGSNTLAFLLQVPSNSVNSFPWIDLPGSQKKKEAHQAEHGKRKDKECIWRQIGIWSAYLSSNFKDTDKSCLSLKSPSEAILSYCGLDFEGIRYRKDFGYLDIKEEKIISQSAFELDHNNSRHNNPDLYCRSKNYRGIQLGQMACN